jgi:hypothetical protein
VGQRGFHNDCDHQSYILEVGSLRVQVRSEGDVGVRASVDGAIIVIVLGDHDPLGSGGLLFQVTDDGLLLLPSKGGGTLACPYLIQGLACGSHDGDESLLLSVRDSGSGGRGGLLLINGEVGGVARHGRQDSGG